MPLRKYDPVIGVLSGRSEIAENRLERTGGPEIGSWQGVDMASRKRISLRQY